MQMGERRELFICEEGQHYAQVLRLLGNGRVELNLLMSDGTKEKMLGCIRGKLRNRVWINAGDIVVACPQEDITAKDKCDIVHKFYPEEAFELQDMGEIPDTITINEGAVDDEGGEENDLDLNQNFDDGDEEAMKDTELDTDDI